MFLICSSWFMPLRSGRCREIWNQLYSFFHDYVKGGILFLKKLIFQTVKRIVHRKQQLLEITETKWASKSSAGFTVELPCRSSIEQRSLFKFCLFNFPGLEIFGAQVQFILCLPFVLFCYMYIDLTEYFHVA